MLVNVPILDEVKNTTFSLDGFYDPCPSEFSDFFHKNYYDIVT